MMQARCFHSHAQIFQEPCFVVGLQPLQVERPARGLVRALSPSSVRGRDSKEVGGAKSLCRYVQGHGLHVGPDASAFFVGYVLDDLVLNGFEDPGARE